MARRDKIAGKKIVRCRQPDGKVVGGSLQGDGSVRTETGDVVRGFTLLAPVVPTNIIGIGLNYRKHAEEGGKGVPARPMWFMKTSGAVQDPGGPILLPMRPLLMAPAVSQQAPVTQPAPAVVQQPQATVASQRDQK